jgi:hypothetical protein
LLVELDLSAGLYSKLTRPVMTENLIPEDCITEWLSTDRR